MTKNEVMDTLRDYTRFIKREIDTLPATPEQIGIAIDTAIELLREHRVELLLEHKDEKPKLYVCVFRLEYHNRWRRGADIPQLRGSTIKAAIQKAIEVLNAAE